MLGMWMTAFIFLSLSTWITVSSSEVDNQLGWVWEKAGVSRQSFESDIENKTTPEMRRRFTEFVKGKLTRDLKKIKGQILELVKKKEAECQRRNNTFDVVEDFPLPENQITLLKTEVPTLKYLLRKFEIIKETLIKAMGAVDIPRCLRKCQAVNSLMDTEDRFYDFTKEFHLCSWMTHYENLKKVQEISSSQDVSVPAMLDILVVSTDNAAVSQYLMMEYMKDIREFDRTKAGKV